MINQSINIRILKAWQNAGLYNWVIRHTNKNVGSKQNNQYVTYKADLHAKL